MHLQRFITSSLAVAAVILLLLTLGGYLGEVNRYCETMSSFRVQYLACGAAGIAIAALARIGWRGVASRTLWCALAASTFINALEVVPWWFPRRAPATVAEKGKAATNRSLTLLHFNVLASSRHFAECRRLVAEVDPDFALFVEAYPPWPEELSPLAERYPYHLGYPRTAFQIFSKIPIRSEQLDLYGEDRGYTVLELDVAGERLTMAAGHCPPVMAYGEKGFRDRNRQLLDGIGGHLRTLPAPLVVLGDLNVTMWSPVYKEMMQRSSGSLVNAREGFGIQPTSWKVGDGLVARLTSRPIDHCLVTPDIVVRDFRAGPPAGSDHLPVIVRIELP